jgi:hypothetical protein
VSVTEIIHPKAKAKLRHMRTLIDGSWVDKPGVTWTVAGQAEPDRDRSPW